jgi:hypothetical protein
MFKKAERLGIDATIEDGQVIPQEYNPICD